MTEVPLSKRILEALERSPGLKAADLAQRLAVERREINRCLREELAGRVVQDGSYRWRLRDSGREAPSEKPANPPSTELGRLARYYLECISHDEDRDVSAFAAQRDGAPSYVELPVLPLLTGGDWWNTPEVSRILGTARAQRSKVQAWVGYPVRLREHTTAKWSGFFVDPVLLWPVLLPERSSEAPGFGDAMPQPNYKVLRGLAMGDPSSIAGEAARLADELGFGSAQPERPELDELLSRLVEIRPEWDWREAIDPYACCPAPPLASIRESGIYNRAVLITAERPPYTQGLETELQSLANLAPGNLTNTVLGAWLQGSVDEEPARSDDETLIEVLPMNLEQREALRSALGATLTVVTGPPGTGKSQVVTNLLVNAAWRGMKVLFASKNNKAVDVVEARVNGLGNRPVLLRVGSKEYQAKFADYLTAMLSGQVTEDDRLAYAEGLERHQALTGELQKLSAATQRLIKARNRVDRLEQDVEDHRTVFADDAFAALDSTCAADILDYVERLGEALARLDPSDKGLIGRVLLGIGRKQRIRELGQALGALEGPASKLGLSPPGAASEANLSTLRRWSEVLADRVQRARKVVEYQSALEQLRQGPSFEDIAARHLDLASRIAENSRRLWRDWVQLTPSRLTATQRKEIADYAALLQVLSGPEQQHVNAAAWSRAKALQRRMSEIFSCWAVTSLSARGKIPFEPGHFDLVVIDEASQCDIASALPLLYRAKRAVIIGDPMQLRHISALGAGKDSDLQAKHGLTETRAAWMYSVNSVYDLAAAVTDPAGIINLRDHHRSHADIIQFSNRQFYGDRLRVATRHDSLRSPAGQGPGVHWQDVRGHAERPSEGGLRNRVEAQALVRAVEDLVVGRGFEGSIGIVTPFRAQANLLQQMLGARDWYNRATSRNDLLADTVHRFQGDERDVVFFSPVLAHGATDGATGFLQCTGNLFNVAITRARSVLHVVGDRQAALASGVEYLQRFASYVDALEPTTARRARNASDGDLGPAYPAVSRPERVSEWERVLYRALYDAGIRAIPQYSVEHYDLDFALLVGERKLAIEVDGERYHRTWTGELCLRDQLRNQRLIELGWDVKRFWVYEIRDRLPACVEWVREWIASAEDEPAPATLNGLEGN